MFQMIELPIGEGEVWKGGNRGVTGEVDQTTVEVSDFKERESSRKRESTAIRKEIVLNSTFRTG
jgi:hypothetical protein